MHTALDDRHAAAAEAGDDGALLHGRVGLYDKNEIAALTGLHRLRRHHGCVFEDIQGQYRLHELTRPERVIRIRKGCLQLDSASRDINCVINERQLATGRIDDFTREPGIDRRQSLDKQLGFAHAAPDRGEILFRHREGDINRMDLIEVD